jgi:hypothetical protein
MSKYAAQLTNNVVQQIIVGDYVWANENLEGEWVDCTVNDDLVIGIGYTWDGTDFIAPLSPELPIEE